MIRIDLLGCAKVSISRDLLGGFLCLLLNYMHVCLKKADKPCIVAFDEFQQISKYPEKNIEALLLLPYSDIYLMCILSFQAVSVHLVTDDVSSLPLVHSITVHRFWNCILSSLKNTYLLFCHWFDVYERTIRDGRCIGLYIVCLRGIHIICRKLFMKLL